MSFRKPCHMPFRKLIPSFTLTGFSWETASRKPQKSRDHGFAVTLAVCSSRLNRRKSFQRSVIYGKVSLPQKIVQPRV